MGLFRSVGKGIGTVAGGVIGGGVKITGKVVKSPWVEEVGDGVQHASKIALDSAGQFVDGALKGAYGVVKKDNVAKQEGYNDLKDSTTRTIRGIGSTISYTANGVGTTYHGIKTGNKDVTIEGVKSIGKVLAVATLAVGIVDLIDGVDNAKALELDTRNDHLAGGTHPETGVLFTEKTVELPSGEYTGTFPVFDAPYQVNLPEDLYLQTDYVHFSYANAQLFDEIQTNPSIVQDLGLSNHDVQMLGQGDTPDGYTWHHHEEAGLLQLVDEEVHQNTGHTGGRELWGGGESTR